jgi:predicted O-methyltransferase YrrM
MKSPMGRITLDVPPHYQDKLAALIRSERPGVVVETGTWDGLGAEFILQALDDNQWGRLFSIDPMDPKHESNGVMGRPDMWEKHPIVHPRFTQIRKYSHDALEPLFAEVGSFDMFIHDSDHSYQVQTFEYESAWRMVRPGGIIVSDDCFWGTPPHHAWDKFLERHGVTRRTIIGNAQWIRRP